MIAGLIAVIAFVMSRDSNAPIAADTTLPHQVATTNGVPLVEASSQVPPLDCTELITTEEMFSALGADEDPSIVDGASGSTRGEICRQTLAKGEDWFVEISPGGPVDFEPNSTLLGVVGEPVTEAGDEARWFGGEEADGRGAWGVLAVKQASQHGRIYFRIFLGRPDLQSAEQLAKAIDLALMAVPRFPGVEVETPAVPVPEIVRFTEEPADTSSLGLDSFLLAGEASGVWTRGEGLIAMLDAMSDENKLASTLGGVDLVEESGSLLIMMARSYIQNGDDPELQTEIADLLDELTISDEELADRTSAGSGTGLLLSLMTFAEEDPCADPEAGCLEIQPLPPIPGVPDEKYVLYSPLDDSEWSGRHVEIVKRAIIETARKYEPLGEMPTVAVHLEAGFGLLHVDSGRNDCKVHMYENIAEQLAGDGQQFQQLVAREMAYCFLATEFRALIAPDPAAASWWVKGMATYLSGHVYPAANAEHVNLPAGLAKIELSSTLGDRSVTNWVFFEYLHSELGVEGNLATISGFPPGGNHLAALAAYSDTPDQFHGFELALTDSNVSDLGPGTVPYEPRSWDLNVFVPVEATFAVPAFGVRRIRVEVADGKLACFETSASGDLRSSWRAGPPGEPGDWSGDDPPFLEGEQTLVVTTLESDVSFTLLVTEVVEDGDCGEDPVPTPTTLGDCGGCPPSQYFYSD